MIPPVSPVDLWTASACAVAGTAIAIRARMLRPNQTVWTQAPACVWVSLSILALCAVTRAVAVWFGSHASPGEALVDTALAAAGVAMLWNLNSNGKAEEVRRRLIAADVQAAMEASGPPATYPGERRHG